MQFPLLLLFELFVPEPTKQTKNTIASIDNTSHLSLALLQKDYYVGHNILYKLLCFVRVYLPQVEHVERSSLVNFAFSPVAE